LTWLCLVLLFHTKKLLFHINNTFDGHRKKKSVDYDWIVYPFFYFFKRVYMDEPTSEWAGSQRRRSLLWARNVSTLVAATQ
jgi:hypothetical protein